MPARQCSNVDLPDPLGPITATISPCRTLSEAPRSAGVSPNDFTRSRASTMVPALGGVVGSGLAPSSAVAARFAVTGAPPVRAGPAGPRYGRSIAGQPPD